MVGAASNEPGRAVIQAQRGVALASLRPPRPNPAPGARTVSGVRLSAASAQPAAAVESPLLREGLQVVKGAPVASRCRHRHALAIGSVVLPAARLDATEMGQTMREIVDKLYTFLLNMEEAELAALRDHRRSETSEWDRPREDPGLRKKMEVLASGIVESGRRPDAADGATKD